MSGAAAPELRETTRIDRGEGRSADRNQTTGGGFRMPMSYWAAETREENDMREGLGGFHRVVFLCSILVLAIAAPAIAEDSKNSEDSEISEDSKGSKDSKRSKDSKNSKDSKGRSDTPRARLFEEFDADGDGKLSEDERSAARTKRHERHLEEFDTDGDGKISGAERRAARAQRKSKHIAQYDTDGDGTLSDEERQAARDKRSYRKDRELEQFDADGDGKLTGDELEQAKAERRKHLRRRGLGPRSMPAADQPGKDPRER